MNARDVKNHCCYTQITFIILDLYYLIDMIHDLFGMLLGSCWMEKKNRTKRIHHNKIYNSTFIGRTYNECTFLTIFQFGNHTVSELEQSELLARAFELSSLFQVFPTPAEYRIDCPETLSNSAAIDSFPKQTQDLLNMLTMLEWVF